MITVDMNEPPMNSMGRCAVGVVGPRGKAASVTGESLESPGMLALLLWSGKGEKEMPQSMRAIVEAVPWPLV